MDRFIFLISLFLHPLSLKMSFLLNLEEAYPQNPYFQNIKITSGLAKSTSISVSTTHIALYAF